MARHWADVAKLKASMSAELKRADAELADREAKLQEQFESLESLSGADTEKQQLAERLSQLLVEKEQVSAFYH
jgi:uncharacterized membrane protein